jgi:NhaA family Na+:H+ antiporter
MRLDDILGPLPVGIALGAFIGKPVGIIGMTVLLVVLGLASKPEGTGWMHLYGISVAAGIGFTMSLLIGLLAFDEPQTQALAKVGLLSGSMISMAWSFVILRWLAGEPRLTPAG